MSHKAPIEDACWQTVCSANHCNVCRHVFESCLHSLNLTSCFISFHLGTQRSKGLTSAVVEARQALRALRMQRLKESNRMPVGAQPTASTLTNYRTTLPRNFSEVSWFLDRLKVPMSEEMRRRVEDRERGEERVEDRERERRGNNSSNNSSSNKLLGCGNRHRPAMPCAASTERGGGGGVVGAGATGGGAPGRSDGSDNLPQSSSPCAELNGGNPITSSSKPAVGSINKKRKTRRDGMQTQRAPQSEAVGLIQSATSASCCSAIVQHQGTGLVPRQQHATWQSDAVLQWMRRGGKKVTLALNRVLAGRNIRFNESTRKLQRADVSTDSGRGCSGRT